MAYETELKQAIDLIKAGSKQDALPILKTILKSDKDNERAWLWMTACANNVADRRYCLEQVLRINPNHEKAKAALAKMDEPEEPSLDEIAPAKAQAPAVVPAKPVEVQAAPAAGQMKACPHCGMTIPAAAFECPYCHKIPNQTALVGSQLTRLGCAITKLVFLLPIVGLMLYCLFAFLFRGN